MPQLAGGLVLIESHCVLVDLHLAEYDQDVPIKALRFFPALCGSLLVPVFYQLVVELGLSQKIAFVSSLFIIFGEARMVKAHLWMLSDGLMTSVFLIVLSTTRHPQTMRC